MPYLIPTISRLRLALAFGSLLTLLCTFLFLPSRTFPILYPCSGACPPSVPLFFYFCFLFVCSPIALSSVFVSIILYSAFSKSLSHLNPFLPPFQPPLWPLQSVYGVCLWHLVSSHQAPFQTVPTKPHFQVITTCRLSAPLYSLHTGILQCPVNNTTRKEYDLLIRHYSLASALFTI